MSERIATVEDLVAAREARGLGADDVMRQLKLAPRQLQALEHGDWGALPGHAFVRGMLRAYGRMLEVDVEPLVEAMSSTVRAADLRPAASLDEPLPSRSMMGFGSGGSGSRVAWTVLLAVGVLALALFFGGANLGSVGSWLARDAAQGTDSATGQDAPADAGPAGTTTETVPLGPLTPAPTDSAPAEGAPPAAPVSPSSGAPGSGSAANLAAAAAPTGTLASMSMVAQPAAGQGAAPDGTASADAGASASPPTLRLVFERDAWIEARRDGKVILSGTQAAGSAREVPIDGRTALVIGNAASVRAEFAGKPLDLATHTRGSIARLSLP
ncbi:helix-turn-helix domain-containing protein [Quisquiliibacterium transsilvanicum]|uniref:Cytoskeleton protein RodZ n=1 Tax=Quisquiliibacterium transsilvanicum TaxID=1549638 RepID=A0A7W8M7F3_9BURK|nr:helix-turn-helix domain-containing protein [Quisquiliibacterium transsilvanicum]MBB5270160.1 cytoskeleton protein RodZ [Quisquiliibacterium transsilvanicum]